MMIESSIKINRNEEFISLINYEVLIYLWYVKDCGVYIRK